MPPVSSAASSTPTIQLSPLLDLPPELLLHILSYLDYGDILASQQTCRLLRELVTGSAQLQYLIELGIAAYEDNPDSTVPLAERCRLLRARERAWQRLEFGPSHSISVSFNPSSIYDLSSGVFLLGQTHSASLFGGTDAVRTARVNSEVIKQPGDSVWQTINLNQKIIDVGLAVHEHDLIAVVTYNFLPERQDYLTAAISIHLVQLSTGEYHPAASKPCIAVCEGPFVPGECSLSVEIVGNKLGLLLNFPFTQIEPRESAFYLIDWRTGHPHFFREAEHGTYDAFAFLDADTVVLPNLHLHTLELCDVSSPPSPSPPAPLRTLRHLALPPLAVHAIPFRIWCRAEPTPTGGPAQRTAPAEARARAPFRPAPSAAIALFNIFILDTRQRLHTFSLVTHRAALLRPYPARSLPSPPSPSSPSSEPERRAEDNGEDAPERLREHPASDPSHTPLIPWSTWGPPACRLFPADALATRWITTTCGQRFVLNSSLRRAALHPEPAHLCDFNVVPYRRLLARHAAAGAECGGSLDAEGGHAFDSEDEGALARIQLVEQPSESDADVFGEPVVTALPYAEIVGAEPHGHNSLLLDEDGIIGLDLDQHQRNIRRIVVKPIAGS